MCYLKGPFGRSLLHPSDMAQGHGLFDCFVSKHVVTLSCMHIYGHFVSLVIWPRYLGRYLEHKIVMKPNSIYSIDLYRFDIA